MTRNISSALLLLAVVLCLSIIKQTESCSCSPPISFPSYNQLTSGYDEIFKGKVLSVQLLTSTGIDYKKFPTRSLAKAKSLNLSLNNLEPSSTLTNLSTDTNQNKLPTSTSTLFSMPYNNPIPRYKTITIRVTQVCKSNKNLKIGDTISIQTCKSSACCGYNFIAGKDYLVFSKNRSTSLCSPTTFALNNPYESTLSQCFEITRAPLPSIDELDQAKEVASFIKSKNNLKQ